MSPSTYVNFLLYNNKKLEYHDSRTCSLYLVEDESSEFLEVLEPMYRERTWNFPSLKEYMATRTSLRLWAFSKDGARNFFKTLSVYDDSNFARSVLGSRALYRGGPQIFFKSSGLYKGKSSNFFPIHRAFMTTRIRPKTLYRGRARNFSKSCRLYVEEELRIVSSPRTCM